MELGAKYRVGRLENDVEPLVSMYLNTEKLEFCLVDSAVAPRLSY